MEHSQHVYGLFVCLFVVKRYVCIDVIITNSTIAYCLQPYLVLHQLIHVHQLFCLTKMAKHTT